MKKFYFLFLINFIGNYCFSQLIFSRPVVSSSDDAEEKFNGSYTTTSSSDLEMVYDDWNSQGLQKVGIRFTEINIPNNATISNAYIQFRTAGASSGDVNLNIKGEKSVNSTTFTEGYINSISTRPVTNGSVAWTNIPNWNASENGVNQRTPNIASLITEMIAQPGWNYGNPLTFIITGDGMLDVVRRAYSYDSGSSRAPILVIQYSVNNTTDLALTAITNPSSNTVYTNTPTQFGVKISNVGSEAISDYSVNCYVNGNLHQTLSGTNSIAVAQDYVFNFTLPATFVEPGSNTISFQLDVSGDQNTADNQISKTIQAVNESSDLFFSQNSNWKFYDATTAPNAGWNTIGFDDSQWQIGRGQFGFGEGDENQPLSSGKASYYFRKNVNVDNVDNLSDVYFHLIHDDAAVIYVNGQEVFRTELMPSGTISHTTLARLPINDNTESTYYTYKIDKSYFINGNNTIAISVHNYSVSDDDLSFDCYITSNNLYQQDGPYVFYEDNLVKVKNVTPAGLVEDTYTDIQGETLTCYIPQMNKSFSFTIKPNLVNEQSVYTETPSKFFAISDFDNKIEALYMALTKEGVIDENFNWTYGNGHLIINGDLFDRGTNLTECLWLIYKLESEAEAEGGKVHYVIGNHEMFNMNGDWRYAEEKYFTNAQLMNKKMLELYDNNTEIGRWLRTKNIITKLGEYVFIHGGVSPQVSALNLSYDQMNAYGRTKMNNQSCTGDCATVTSSTYGLYWCRDVAYQNLTQTEVDDILTYLGAKKTIMGHTKSTAIRLLYNEKAIVIDVNHVANFANGYMDALKFDNGCFNRFRATASTTTYSQLGSCDVFLAADNNKNNQALVYPNPASDELKIRISSSVNGYYEVIDLSGKIIKYGKLKDKETAVNVAAINTGVYMLNIVNNGKSQIEKIIIGK